LFARYVSEETSTIKHILAATDVSRQAKAAVAMAAQLAQATSASLTILHVVPSSLAEPEMAWLAEQERTFSVLAATPKTLRVSHELLSMSKREISEHALMIGQRLVEEACDEARRVRRKFSRASKSGIMRMSFSMWLTKSMQI
jgi:nucleotide-binding universal stress UspA family protein